MTWAEKNGAAAMNATWFHWSCPKRSKIVFLGS